MYKLVFVLMLSIASICAIASSTDSFREEATENDFANVPDNVKENSTLESDTLSKRGCCSHHSGVCGCQGDRQVCCDGTLSPSCMCSGGAPL